MGWAWPRTHELSFVSRPMAVRLTQWHTRMNLKGSSLLLEQGRQNLKFDLNPIIWNAEGWSTWFADSSLKTMIFHTLEATQHRIYQFYRDGLSEIDDTHHLRLQVGSVSQMSVIFNLVSSYSSIVLLSYSLPSFCCVASSDMYAAWEAGWNQRHWRVSFFARPVTVVCKWD